MTKAEQLAYSLQRLDFTRKALVDLKSARDLLRACEADMAADYLAKAIKSVEGAIRHAQRLVSEAHAEA